LEYPKEITEETLTWASKLLRDRLQILS